MPVSAFQSTRPRGARLSVPHTLLRSAPVSIHAPAWGATNGYRTTKRRGRCFNPRARVGRDLRVTITLASRPVFQSTRPRGARLSRLLSPVAGARVSIHAPAWGATVLVVQGKDTASVSIHAPAWGATGNYNNTSNAGPKFQSTRPRGARHRGAGDGEAKGACFNPRARVGRDHHMRLDSAYSRPFQSTRPRGARLGLRKTWSRI